LAICSRAAAVDTLTDTPPKENVITSASGLAAINEALDIAHPLLVERWNPEDRPAALYHYTDISGLIGIVTTRKLWASLAMALNDPSEGLYGVKRARALLGSIRVLNRRGLRECARRIAGPNGVATGVRDTNSPVCRLVLRA
jgi:hypothetical protein